MRRTWRCWWRLILAVGATLGVLGAPAWARVEAQPGEVPAGSQVDVGFVVTHGCDGSPTTSVAIQLPPGVRGTPLPVSGFEAPVAEGQQVRWTGGNLPTDQKQTFVVHLRLPSTPGATLYFPAFQVCQQGAMTWGEVPAAGQDARQLKNPAAALRLTADPPPQVGAPQSTTSQPGPDTRSAGTRPEGGVPAGAGGTAGPPLARLLAVIGAALLGGGMLFMRLRQDV